MTQPRFDESRNGVVKSLLAAAGLLRALNGADHAMALDDLAETANDPSLRVVIFGEFNTGKSTLINALLGQRALPIRARPTTGQRICVQWGERARAKVVFTSGRIQECELSELETLATLDMQSRARQDIERLEVQLPAKLLRRGLSLIDTPGLVDTEAQTRCAIRAVAQADVVLLVLNATKLLSLDERRLATEWMTHRLGKAVIPVLNFMNEVQPEERHQVREILQGWARQLHSVPGVYQRYFEVNALAALRYTLRVMAERPADDFFRLYDTLESMARDHMDSLRQLSRSNQLRANLRQAKSWNRELLDQLRRDANKLHRQRQADQNDLLTARRRLEEKKVRERIHVQSLTESALYRGWQEFVDRIRGKDKESLRANFRRWFAAARDSVVKSVEGIANERLSRLVDGDLPKPNALTIAQLVKVKEESEVHVEEKDNSTAIAGGAFTGSAWGWMVGGPMGAALGFFLGGGLANAATVETPDFAGAYTEAARKDWKGFSTLLREVLANQFDSRVEELLRLLDERLQALERVPASGQEVELRKQLDRQLLTLLGEVP